MPKLPKMIGAHVPRKPHAKSRRCQLNESARMINQAYDRYFVRRLSRTHLVYQNDLPGVSTRG